MNIFKGFDTVKNINKPVLTIGTFDGVHLGHQKIIQQLNFEADKVGGESVLFTFYPHPRMVLFPDNHGLKLIQTQSEKIQKLDRIGLKNVIVHPFSKEFSRLPAIQFVRDFLVNTLNVHTIIIGYDHQFGKNREGNIDLLKELGPIYGFNVIEIKAQDIDEVNVSSTKIRKALKNGDIKSANSFLGSSYKLGGTIIEGKKIGRSMGFPTANIKVDSDIKIIPKQGVYVVCVKIEDKCHFGMLNIGENPTVSDEGKESIEVHIFDFNENIYGKDIEVEFLARLRDEEKYPDKETLIKQLKQDEKNAKAFIDSINC